VLRDRLAAEPAAHALVGGATAVQLDIARGAAHDRAVVMPLVLAVVLLVLILLLRALVAPLVLLATVVLSYAAALGVSVTLFDALGLAGADPSVPLYAFLFLVALGVDYNIFLMTRIREESLHAGTRAGTLRGLAVTGGVITSARPRPGRYLHHPGGPAPGRAHRDRDRRRPRRSARHVPRPLPARAGPHL